MNQKLSDIFKNRADLRKEESLGDAVYLDFIENFGSNGELVMYKRKSEKEQIQFRYTTWRVTMTRKNASYETGTYNRNTQFDFLKKSDAEEFRRLSQIAVRMGGTIKAPFKTYLSGNVRELTQMIERENGTLHNLSSAVKEFRGSIMAKQIGLI